MKSSPVFAFLGGIALGAVAALLLAPASGDDTRRMVRGYVDKGKKKIFGCGCGPDCDCDEEESDDL